MNKIDQGDKAFEKKMSVYRILFNHHLYILEACVDGLAQFMPKARNN